MRSGNSLLLFCILLTGCLKQIELPDPTFTQKVVVTGVLHPDSLLQVELRLNLPTGTTEEYPTVTNAVVEFRENGVSLGHANQIRPGVYRTSKYCTEGHIYELIAQVPGFDRIYAKDTLPELPKWQLRVSGPNPENMNHNPDFHLQFKSQRTMAHFWIDALQKSYGYQDKLEVGTQIFLTNSSVVDKQMGSFESTIGRYNMGNLLRLDPRSIATDTVKLDFLLDGQYQKNPKPEEGTFVGFYSCSQAMDQYLKSGILSFKNRPIDPVTRSLKNPFTESIPVSSNIKNGIGIFAGINGTRVRTYFGFFQ